MPLSGTGESDDDQICDALNPEQLGVVRNFLRDAAAAGVDVVGGLRVD